MRTRKAILPDAQRILACIGLCRRWHACRVPWRKSAKTYDFVVLEDGGQSSAAERSIFYGTHLAEIAPSRWLRLRKAEGRRAAGKALMAKQETARGLYMPVHAHS